MNVTLIGMGSGQPENLTLQGLAALRQADLILGARRLLAVLPAGCTENRAAAYRPDEVAELLQTSGAENAVLVYSGDTGFYSGASSMMEKLEALGVRARVLPGLSSIQLLAAALGLRRDLRLLLEALAAAFVLLLLRAAGCLPRGLGVPGAGYVLLGSAVPFLWAVLMVTLAECARVAERDEGAVCGAAFVAMLALMMVEAGLGVSGLAVLPGALAGALVALGLWAFPPARLGVGCCGSLLAAGAIGCIPLSLDMTSLTVPLALPFWAAGGLLAAQLLCAKRTGKPLRCWVKKHKMSPETVFLCSFALSAVGYVLALALLRWC